MRVIAVLGALAAMAAAPVAEASFPGSRNGSIATVVEQNGNGDIHVRQRFPSADESVTNSSGADDRSPAWNKNASDIAYSSNLGSDPAGDYEIYKEAARQPATPVPLTNNSVDDLQPSWAPSGTQLVIVREVAGGETDLLILAADGSGATTPLTALAAVSGEVDPNWAPNGSRIAFAAFAPGATQRDIFTINPNGTGLTNLTNTPTRDDREPNWAPGNARITYSAFLNSNYDVHVMNADGTGDSNITNYPGANDRDPAWSPDATRIVFTRRDAFNTDSLWNIASTGQFPFKFAEGTAPDWAPAQCSDGIDNDGDGYADYPDDIGCTTDHDPEEANPACSDEVDNDGDTKIDYPDDVGCLSFSDNDETNPVCSDGIDNDGDGLTDYPDDPGCSSATDNDEFNPPPPACSDGVDNDGDTKIDFPDDPGCTSASDNNETDPPPPACSDGVDNDGDTRIDFPSDPGCTSANDTDESNAPPSGVFVRPKSAPRIRASLVPRFNPCTSPNRTHGPPLAFPSCNPPVHSSNSLTIGTPENNGAADNSEGWLTLTVDPGTVGPPEDSDVIFMAEITDVRCRAGTTDCGNANATDGTDYTGELQGNATVRITDRWNATSPGGGLDAATVVDIPFPMPIGCANSTSNMIGALCTSNTSFNAIVPGAFKERKRSVLDVGQILITDGGSDGNVATTPNTTFLTQGVFVP